MATVGFVNAQFSGGTVRFEIAQPSNWMDGACISAFFGSSASDVLNRLLNGSALDFASFGDVANVLTLAYGGEMFPLRGSSSLYGDALKAKFARATPWVTVSGNVVTVGTPGQASYASLAILILKAYLFGIDSAQATWAPA